MGVEERCTVLVGKPEGKTPHGHPNVHGRIILRRNFKK
jgi:hypothetical protein